MGPERRSAMIDRREFLAVLATAVAAIARLIPNDDLGRGALEADVSYFIDRLMTSEYGSGARFYNQGPFGDTTRYQGYQLPLTPPEVYRAGIAATNRYCEEKHGKRFAQLDAGAQDEVLNALQSIGLEKVSGATFFGQLQIGRAHV